jgi:fructokinase
VTATPIVCCGEALVDLIPAGPDEWTARPGGSPLNVAVAAARLGAPVSLAAVVSTDAFGRRLTEHLRAAGVALTATVRSPRPTTLAVVAQTAAEDEPGFAFYVDGTTAGDDAAARRGLPPDTGIVHAAGSVSLAIEPAASAYAALLARDGPSRLVSLDPNPRPAIAGALDRYLDRLDGWLAHADLVKISRADLAWLAPDADPADVACSWLERRPTMVLLTMGAAGAVAITAAGRVEVPGVPVEVVDTVGAGDAFTGSVLASLSERCVRDAAGLAALGDSEVREVLRRAVAAAALTCTRSGADPPTAAQLAAT